MNSKSKIKVNDNIIIGITIQHNNQNIYIV